MALWFADANKTEARGLQRLAAAGRLRRLYAGIYTDEIERPWAPGDGQTRL